MRTHMLFGALAAVVGAKNATSTGGLAGEWEQALLHGGCAKSGVHTCAGAEGKTPLVEATGQFSTPQLENKRAPPVVARAARRGGPTRGQMARKRQGVRALTQNMTGDASLSPHCFAVTMTTRTTSSFAYRSFSPRLSPSTRAWVPLSPLHLAGSQSNPSSTGRIARGDPRSMRSSPTHPRDGVDEEPLWTCHSCV